MCNGLTSLIYSSAENPETTVQCSTLYILLEYLFDFPHILLFCFLLKKVCFIKFLFLTYLHVCMHPTAIKLQVNFMQSNLKKKKQLPARYLRLLQVQLDKQSGQWRHTASVTRQLVLLSCLSSADIGFTSNWFMRHA